jgi:hypothetical protein
VADIFISYKSERRNAVAHVARILEDYGYSVWFDWAVLSGDNFIRLIERELRAARVVLVLWCMRSVQSDYVLEEAHLARKLGKIIPVRIEPVDLPFGFQLLDTFDLTAWDGSPGSPIIKELIAHIAEKSARESHPRNQALEELEMRWRQYGSLPLARFPLDAAGSELERRHARLREGVPLSHRIRAHGWRVLSVCLIGIAALTVTAGLHFDILPLSLPLNGKSLPSVDANSNGQTAAETTPYAVQQAPVEKYMVIIASYSDKDSAQVAADKANAKFKGVQSDLHAVVLAPGSTPYWGVYVGTWVTLVEARALARKARDQGFRDAYVRKAPS